MVILSEITEKGCVKERYNALDRENSYCATLAAISATAELLSTIAQVSTSDLLLAEVHSAS